MTLAFEIQHNGIIAIENTYEVFNKTGRRYALYIGYSLKDAKKEHCFQNNLAYKDIEWLYLR